MSRLIIYGATGYTGRMVAQAAKAAGLDFAIAGRDAGRLAALGAELDVTHRAFGLDTQEAVIEALGGTTVLLNCAGPFARTAQPLMQACMVAGVHYLDISAEIDVYRLAERLGDRAGRADVMLMPGVGWDVVPTDCLAVHVSGRVERPQSLRIALLVAGGMSRGSAASAGEIMSAGLLARIDGVLVETPDAQPEPFDFGDGPVRCMPLSFGDLVTAWHSTGIPNIAMFVHVTGEGFPSGDLSLLPDGPTQADRAAHPARAIAEVTGAGGAVARSMIETVNGYSFTPLAAVEAARRVIDGEHLPGLRTPAGLFGAGFALTIPGTSIVDL